MAVVTETAIVITYRLRNCCCNYM